MHYENKKKEKVTMKISLSLTVLFLIIGLSTTVFCHEINKSNVQCNAYFDSATGHKYIKNTETSYAQYSRRGKLLNTSVPCTQPNLTKGEHIQPIEQGCYILYVKNQGTIQKQMILPAGSKHPSGWYSKKLFYSSK